MKSCHCYVDTVQDFHKAASSLCHKCHCICVCWGCVSACVAVWCLCITSAQWHKRQVAFFLLLCFVPIHQRRQIFCHTECKYRSSFERDFLYSLESGTKEIVHWRQHDFSSRALLLFGRSQAEGDIVTCQVSGQSITCSPFNVCS